MYTANSVDSISIIALTTGCKIDTGSIKKLLAHNHSHGHVLHTVGVRPHSWRLGTLSVLRVIYSMLGKTREGGTQNYPFYRTVIFIPEQIEESLKVPSSFFSAGNLYLEVGLSVVFVQLYALVQLCFYRLSEN
jgi:hypothetical protein